jgi:hypothetical protein
MSKRLNCKIEHIQEMAKNRNFLESLEITQLSLIDFGAGFIDTDFLERYLTDEGVIEINEAFIEFQMLENDEIEIGSD